LYANSSVHAKGGDIFRNEQQAKANSDDDSLYTTEKSVNGAATSTRLYAHSSLHPKDNIQKGKAISDDDSLYTTEKSVNGAATRLYANSSLHANGDIFRNEHSRAGETFSVTSAGSLPHVHYPLDPSNEFWNTSLSKMVTTTSNSAYNTPCPTRSFEGIPSAAPIRSMCESSILNEDEGDDNNTTRNYTRQSSENSLVTANSLGVNSLKSGNSLISNLHGGSTVQNVLDLSTESLADALIPHEDESYEEDGYLADASSFTARPLEECSECENSMSLMELKRALPMESDDEDSLLPYGFGNVILSREGQMVHRPHAVKPILPQSFPSLLDTSMSSSYSVSVSAPPSVTHSFDNNSNVPREGSNEEREDTISYPIVNNPQVGYTEEPLAIEVPLPIPMTIDGSRYIVDLEQIAEESSGQDVGDVSASSPIGGHSKAVDDSEVAMEEQWAQKQKQEGALGCGTIDEAHPTESGTDQQINRSNPNQHFFNYRHQYYMEQYHYFDEDKKCPSKGGDDDTDSTCSSVTLSQAFQHSVHGDDDSYASSSYMTESSSHPTLSTVSSVTLSHALSVDRHDHSDQGFYVAVRLGDYNEGQNDEPIEVESVRGDDISCVDVEERDVNIMDQKPKAAAKTEENDSNQSVENESNDPSEGSNAAAAEDVLSDAPATATKLVAESNERVESDILNMLIPECGVPIPSVMTKMGKQKSKGGMLLPWHSTRSIQNYQYYGGGRRRKRNTMSSNNSLFSISSVHTFRG
jgi:hypothetical protein